MSLWPASPLDLPMHVASQMQKPIVKIEAMTGRMFAEFEE
ncbi:hypothetical protein M2171_002603 [Bradyrhizobium japonicum USDA 38]|nr:hypothetical protein [Bradyrhizobium japonicum USDA 38]MCS3945984.1 hypothetical protein [Bradyrhizobium japonicum]